MSISGPFSWPQRLIQGCAKLGGFLEESDGELSISSLSWDYKLLPAEVSPSMSPFTRRKPER